jgi:hypothetical protein
MLKIIAFAILAVALRHASADTAIGASLYTWHVPEQVECSPCRLSNNTPGVYVIADSYTAGYVRNSFGRPSWYAGKVFAAGPIDFTIGAITGYQKRISVGRCTKKHGPCEIETGHTNAVLRPLVTASYKFDLGPVSPRLTLLGKGVHFSMEYAL